MNKKGVLFSVLAAAAVVSAGVFYFSRPAFDADALVKNSELGRQGFSLPVTEVVSPRHKIKAYLLTDTTNPIVSLSFVFSHAGTVAEKEGQAGLSKIRSGRRT